MRDHFTFMRSYFEAISDLDDKTQLEIYKAIAEYSLNEIEVELQGISNTIFKLIKPVLEKGNNKSKNSSKQNRNKIETKEEQKIPKEKHTPLEERKGKEEDKEEEYKTIPFDVIKAYRENISDKNELVDEKWTMMELRKNRNFSKMILGIKHYGLEKLDKPMKLSNFIGSKIYLDYQEIKVKPLQNGERRIGGYTF